MNVINNDIQNNQFKHVYLLLGEERYLVMQFRDKLKTAILGDGDSMNLSVFEGNGVNLREITDLADTLPFFSERRVIVIENSGLFGSDADKFLKYCAHMPDTTYFILVEEKVDKRSKVYKDVKKNGYVSEMSFQDAKSLTRWVNGLMKHENKTIDAGALELLFEKTGVQMAQIANEIEKLVSYVGDRHSITSEDVEAICSTVITNKIFVMTEAIASKNQKSALEMYYDLLTLKEPPLRILYLIARHLNILMEIKEMTERHVDDSTISKTVGAPSYFIGKYRSQAGNFSSEQLKKAVAYCVDTEEKVKTGRLEDRLGVELVIVKFSS